jgi:hypothetical protein
MREFLAVVLISLFAVPIQAQQPPQQPAPPQQVMQVECRDMATSGNYIAANETLINGKACRPAGSPLQIVDTNPKPVPGNSAVSDNPSATVTPVPAPTTDVKPDSAVAVPAPPAGAPSGFLLEDGTPVHLVLSANVSSADAVTGQTVEFEAVDDVIVNGFVVIPRGSVAWATITDAQHKRRMGRAGHVDMNIDKVRLADGEKALLRAVKDSQGGNHTGAMVGAMAATAIFTLGGSALFLLMHGKDTTIPKGTDVTAFVHGSVVLDQSKFQRQPVIAN